MSRNLAFKPAFLLFTFLISLYILTMGVNRTGYGYSPDGTFAFEMAKSIVSDSEHTYFRENYRNFSRWGIGMPVMLMPFVAFADPLSDIAPQRDRLPVNGEQYFLTKFPSISHESLPDARSVLGLQVPPIPITELNIVSHTGLSQEILQGTEIANLKIVDSNGNVSEHPIRVGIETAEWAYERADVKLSVQHDRAPVVGRHIGNTRGNYYFASFRFSRPIEPVSAQITYTGPRGRFFVDAIGVRAADSGELVSFPGQGRIWSERQNKEFFLRFWAPIMNIVLTAATGVVVLKIVSRLGYGLGVGVAVALSYALATMAWPFAKLDFAEPGVTFFLLAASLSIQRYGDSFRYRWLLLSSLLLLAAICTKYVAVLTSPVFVIQILMIHKRGGTMWSLLPTRSWRGILVFVAPYLFILLPILTLLSLVYNFRLLYESELLAGLGRGWLGVPLWLGLWGLLVSWGKSFFLYNPIMLLAVPATIWFIRRHGWLSTLFVGIPLVYLAIYSKKEVWYGGNTWGPRYLLPIIPFLVIMMAPLCEKILACRRRWLQGLVGIVLAISVCVQLLGVSKDFDLYLSLYVNQIVEQLPEHGAAYGGKDYQQWSSIQPEGDLVAVLYSYQFSPLLAHLWLIRADLVELLLPDRIDLVETALARTPWSRFDIDVTAPNPEHAMGLDFWSFVMWANYFNHTQIVGIVIGALVSLELIALFTLGRLLRIVVLATGRGKLLSQFIIVLFACGAVAFDTMHFML